MFEIGAFVCANNMTFDELLSLAGSNEGVGVRIDSRDVKDGDIYVAIKGTVNDGHYFIDQAIANGAKYIVRKDGQNGGGVICVEDTSAAAGLLAQAARGNPASKLTNLSVTGTNGKTTVAYLVRSCLEAAGEKCGLIGTIVYDTSQGSCDAPLTTPDALTIAASQEQMVSAGAKYMVTEASSHALSQNRLAGVEFRAAAFTNLSGDHLDYHKNAQNYLAAKSVLFEGLSAEILFEIS